MPTDISKIDRIIQFALLAAGEEDGFDRELGPIHLIKYVYLADLAFSGTNQGQTYTGVDWQFYKFGPWAVPVHERIEPALTAIGAKKSSFQSQYEDRDDWVRWSLTDHQRLEECRRNLPPSITVEVSRLVRKFKKDTASLLDYVYKTNPMLRAAPLDKLSFAVADGEMGISKDVGGSELRMQTLSAKQHKRFRERMQKIRDARAAVEASRPKLVSPSSQRHDDVYRDGMVWLDSLAGEPSRDGEKGTLSFSDELWRSAARKGDEIP